MNIRKILLIEDQPYDHRRSIQALADTNYILIKANGPGAAKRRIAQHSDIDLIILDCILPREHFSIEETQNGTLTGFRLYETLLRDLGKPIAVWTVLAQAVAPPRDETALHWGDTVILKQRKQMAKDELVDLVARCESILSQSARWETQQ